jgi:hypothetical protein
MDVRNFYEKLLSEPNAEITEQEFTLTVMNPRRRPE